MSRGAYYNENDRYAAQWLRNLIAAGHIAPGEVDERSIVDVRADDLRGFTQCHFFAGIGVWSYALRRAGWPDERPVWTGSCPCQPFSDAGKGAGFADERHLYPTWAALIGERRPVAVLGEQVASRAGLAWLDIVHADLEAKGYAVGAVDTCAGGFGAPHIRQRIYFVADAKRGAAKRHRHELGGAQAGMQGAPREQRVRDDAGDGEPACGMADADGRNASAEGLQRGGEASFWADCDWLPCRDGKARPVEPGTFPLVNGATARVGRLRAYGNAINVEQARHFIEAAMRELA